jgi:hypothetical protein
MSLAVHLFHHRQRSGSGADHKPPTLPGYVLLYRERCMPKPVTEPFGRFFLALADAATVDYDVIPVSRSVNADRANENASKRMCTSQSSNRFVNVAAPYSGTRRNIGLQRVEASDLTFADALLDAMTLTVLSLNPILARLTTCPRSWTLLGT